MKGFVKCIFQTCDNLESTGVLPGLLGPFDVADDVLVGILVRLGRQRVVVVA